MNAFISDISKWANDIPVDDSMSLEKPYQIYRKCRTFKDYVYSEMPFRYKRFFRINDCLYLKLERIQRDSVMASALLLVNPVEFKDMFKTSKFKGIQKRIREDVFQQDLSDFFNEIKGIESANELFLDFNGIHELELDRLSENEDNLEEVLVDYLRR